MTRLEEAVRGFNAPSGRAVSVSAGVETAEPDGRTLESLLEAADARMYTCKRSRRTG